jgi:hypothetical protein
MIRVLIDYNDWLVAAGITATLELSGEFQLIHPRFGAARPTLESCQGVDVVIADYETGLRLAHAQLRRQGLFSPGGCQVGRKSALSTFDRP